jgi:hypothetical protein
VIGTVVIGALVWLWMAHLRRPLLSEVEGTPAAEVGSADGSPVVLAPAAAPVLDTSNDPPASAPVLDPVEAEVVPARPVPASSATTPAKKPAAKTPAAKKPTKPVAAEPPASAESS